MTLLISQIVGEMIKVIVILEELKSVSVPVLDSEKDLCGEEQSCHSLRT